MSQEQNTKTAEGATSAAQNTETEKKKGKGKIILVLALTIALLGGTGIGIFFVRHNANFVVTENARVTTTLFYIMPSAPGTLERFTIRQGHYVTENQMLGWVEGAPSMRSPIDGLVVRTFAEQNQTVWPAEPVAVIADINNLYIQANIEEYHIARIQRGQTVNVRIDALGRQQFTGYVYEIGRVTDAAITGQVMNFATSGRFTKVTQLLPVRINLLDTEEANLASLIGLNARVQIDLRPGAVIGADRITGGASSSLAVARFAEQAANITVRGIVESTERRGVITTLGHMIRRVYVETGDTVTEGQIMAVLDTDDSILTVMQLQAESALRNARIDLRTREVHHESLSTLYHAGAISRFDFRQSEDALAYARNRYADAQALLNAAFLAVDSQLIRSPIDGVVTAVFAREGGVGHGLLFVVEDVDNLRIRTRFREYDVGRIRTGMNVEIRADAGGVLGSAVYTGIISRINPAAVQSEFWETAIMPVVEFEAEVAVTQPNTSLRIGMNTRLNIMLEGQEQ